MGPGAMLGMLERQQLGRILTASPLQAVTGRQLTPRLTDLCPLTRAQHCGPTTSQKPNFNKYLPK